MPCLGTDHHPRPYIASMLASPRGGLGRNLAHLVSADMLGWATMTPGKTTLCYPGFVDPPYGDDLAAWVQFKAETERLEPRTAAIRIMIDEAATELARLS